MKTNRWRAFCAGLCLALPLVLLSVLSGATTALAAGSWTAQQPPAGLAAGVDFKGVFFLDTTHGWVVGGQDTAPTALYTTDGGTTWKAATVNAGGTGKFRVAHFLDAMNGFAVTDLASIYNSTDGGKTWSVIGNTPGGMKYEDIHFGDSKHGCAVGNGPDQSGIVCTQDGGATWTLLANGKVPAVGNLEGISFASSSVAYAVGDGGILKTTNADATLITDVTWTQLADATPAPAQGRSRHYADVHCVDTTHCWVVGEDVTDTGSGVPLIAATSDGTAFAVQTNCATTGLEAVSLPPNDLVDGWVAGGVPDPFPPVAGDICNTSNGGVTAWAKQASSPPDEYMDIWMVDRCHGWAVTETAGIQVYNDPVLCPPPSPSPAAVAVVNLPKAGHAPVGMGSGWISALVLVVVCGGMLGLRRATRS